MLLVWPRLPSGWRHQASQEGTAISLALRALMACMTAGIGKTISRSESDPLLRSSGKSRRSLSGGSISINRRLQLHCELRGVRSGRLADVAFAEVGGGLAVDGGPVAQEGREVSRSL